MRLPVPMPYYSEDAGGTPRSAMRSMGQTPSVPPLAIPGLTDLIGTLGSAGINAIGIFTPWGELQPVSGVQLGVKSIPPPNVNLALFNVVQVQAILDSLGIGRAPFLAMLHTAPLPNELVEASVAGTPYELFGNGLACYRQDDLTGVPKMFFLYWLHERDPGDALSGTSSPVLSAQSLGATLNFVQQLEIGASTLRNPPIVTVEEAASVQFPAVFPAPPPGPAIQPLPGGPDTTIGVPGELVAFAECVSDWLGIPGALQDPIGAISSAGAMLTQCAGSINIAGYATQAQTNPIAAAEALMADAKALCPSLPEPTVCFPEASSQQPPGGPPPGAQPGAQPGQPGIEPTELLPQPAAPAPITAGTVGASAGVAVGIFALVALGTFVVMKPRPKRG